MTRDGTHASQFATQGVQAEFPRLTFHYAAGGAGAEGPFLGGVGLIAFDDRGPRGDLAELADPATHVEAALRLAAPLLGQLGWRAAPAS